MRTISICLLTLMLSGCSIRRYAVKQVGNALSRGSSTFDQDDDPDLVGEALPFGLKLMESLLAEVPKHEGLLLAAASGFTQYGYAFVELPADEAEADSLERSQALRRRARRLYLRAHRYGLRGLEARYPGLGEALDRNPKAALARTRRQDIPLLYWTAAAHGLAISASRNDPEQIAQIPVVEALIDRVLELDESWGQGAAHEFLISFENARPAAPPAQVQARLRQHFDRALALSEGSRAAPLVSYAEASSLRFRDRAGFRRLLQQALAIDADARPEMRLANLVAQRRARWLLVRLDDLFLEGAQP
jgi:predicted anti-sigma-YlaC factor YlaD